MNRREKRELKKEINIFSDVVNIIKQYFPKLTQRLDKLTDTRNQSYVEYKMGIITVTRLLGLLCGIKSMRETTYYHYVLEVKLVEGDIVISIDSEFVENEDENVEKQDCELRAFYRMAERIKKEYPKLAIMISGDALYCVEPVISVCRGNKWEYILRVKEDRLKLFGEEINGLEKAEQRKTAIKYWNNIRYGEVQFAKKANILKYCDKKGDNITDFLWITSFKITEKNKEEIDFGRQRIV